jgi:hypothetical protein
MNRIERISSINASYTKRETEDLFVNTDLKLYKITTNPFSTFVKGIK